MIAALHGAVAKPVTGGGGGDYTVEKTIFLNLSSEYSGDSMTVPTYTNKLNPIITVLQTVNGYTSPNLIDTTNTATGITIKNSGAFGGGNAQISTAQASAGDTGAFQNAGVNTGWDFDGGSTAKINFLGLNSAKYYQFYFLMPVGDDSVRSTTLNGTTVTRSSTSASSFGASANGLTDSQFVVFNNITGVTSIEAAFARISGSWVSTVALIVIEQTNIAKP